MKLFRDRSEFKVNFTIELEQYEYFIWLIIKINAIEYVICNIMYPVLVISYIRFE